MTRQITEPKVLDLDVNPCSETVSEGFAMVGTIQGTVAVWQRNLFQHVSWRRRKYLLFAFIGLMYAYVLWNNESFLFNSKHPEWSHIESFKWWLLASWSGLRLRTLPGPFAVFRSHTQALRQASSTPGAILCRRRIHWRMMFESDGTHCQIHTDGRPLPKDPEPTWLGYSVGKWEGDTLAVETIGFNERTVLDVIGYPHSDALRVVERYHRRDFWHMDVEVIFDDPKLYTKPFGIKFTQRLFADSDVLDVCTENEKDLAHISRN